MSMMLNVLPNRARVLVHEKVPEFTNKVLWIFTPYGTCRCPISTSGMLLRRMMSRVSPASSMMLVSLPEFGIGMTW